MNSQYVLQKGEKFPFPLYFVNSVVLKQISLYNHTRPFVKGSNKRTATHYRDCFDTLLQEKHFFTLPL